jgi:hypothetical protein
MSSDPARAAAMEFARGVTAFAHAWLGPRLLGGYLIGSLAHGGFSHRYSDIDLALIVDDTLGPIELPLMRAKAAMLSLQRARKLSLFWTNRHFSLGRFPLLDRIDYLDHAVTLEESQRVLPVRPSLEQTRGHLRDVPFTKWAENAQRFASLEVLKRKDYKAYIRTLLYPARLFYSWTTGRIASNDDAVAFLVERRPAGVDTDLVGNALQCRRDGADPIPLFPARRALPSQVEACARLIAL